MTRKPVTTALIAFLGSCLAACAAPAESGPPGDFEFDESEYMEASELGGCGGGKCDSGSDWAVDRLGRGRIPPLLNAGWDEATLAQWNNQDQGVKFLPYSWALAVEQPDSDQPLLTDQFASQFGFHPAGRNEWNPDGLPVGLAVHTDPSGQRYLGFTCAGCHGADVRVGEVSMRIAGGQGRQQVDAFGEAVVSAFFANLRSPRKAYRVIARILAYEGLPNSIGFARDIFYMLRQFFAEGRDREELHPVAAGPSRLDALGRGGNRAFGQFMDERNLMTTEGNVSLPAIWDVPRFDWTNYNGSIRQSLARNTVEALGVGADMVLDDPSRLFENSVNFVGLIWLEDALRRLESPVWPEAFGAVDPDLVNEGRALYIENCAGCHGELESDTSNRLLPFLSEYDEPDSIGLRFFTLEEIGTDPVAAETFASRRVLLTPVLYETLGLAPGTTVGAVDAFRAAGRGAIERFYAERGIGEEERRALEHGRADAWQAIRAYRARPLNGMWSTAPFLHNGSVPDMYELLGEADARSDLFNVGSDELDPVTLGFLGGNFVFDTSLPGNSNAGHEFSARYDSSQPFTAQDGVVGRALDPYEVQAIIEFLKVLEPIPHYE